MIKRIRRVRVSDLHPHPRQSALFSDLTESSLQVLVEDIRRNGLRHPIETLPDRTIVCGHQRVHAAVVLGWTEIDAVILQPTNDEEIVRRLVEVNLARRQLGPVGLAQIYRALRATASDARLRVGMGDTRDRIANLLGVRSGRTLDRNLHLLEAPREIQDAVESGALSKVMAEKVLELSKTKRNKLAAEIAAGGNPAKVVSRILDANSAGSTIRVRRAYRRLFVCLRGFIPVLDKHQSKLAGQGFEPKRRLRYSNRRLLIFKGWPLPSGSKETGPDRTNCCPTQWPKMNRQVIGIPAGQIVRTQRRV